MVEQPLLGWAGRIAYLSAKQERKQAEIYAMDLLWLDVKRHYSTELHRPSDIYYRRDKKDNRTAKEIIQDTIRGLGGE